MLGEGARDGSWYQKKRMVWGQNQQTQTKTPSLFLGQKELEAERAPGAGGPWHQRGVCSLQHVISPGGVESYGGILWIAKCWQGGGPRKPLLSSQTHPAQLVGCCWRTWGSAHHSGFGETPENTPKTFLVDTTHNPGWVCQQHPHSIPPSLGRFAPAVRV